MANMRPAEIRADGPSNAERRIFDVIKKELSSDWYVAHSLELAKHESKDLLTGEFIPNVPPSKPWGEIDFVLVGPRGVFCLEVKGGRVAFDKETGDWIFVDRDNNENRKKEGPFSQANGNTFSLRKYLAEHVNINKILFGFGVVTPDIVFSVTDPGINEVLIYDKRHTNISFSEYINRISQHWATQLPNKNPLNKYQIAEIMNALRGDIDLVPSLELTMNYTEKKLLELTDEQKYSVKGAMNNHRVVVTGGAGTGKTVCAMYEALRLGQQGKRVLYCCYNRRLAYSLRRALTESDSDIEIFHIHGLMTNIIQQSGLSLPKGDTNTTFRENYPDVCSKAIKHLALKGKYQALVIDEAQDLLDLHYLLDVLDPLLDGGFEKGLWRMFWDQNQNIFNPNWQEAEGVITSTNHFKYELTKNCRNAKNVVINTSLLSGVPFENFPDTDGPPFHMQFYKDDADQRREVSKFVNKLLSNGASPDKIAILSPTTREYSSLRDGLIDVVHELVSPDTDESVGQKEIGFYTIQSFKGLESQIVLLVDLENLKEPYHLSLNYVGGSRAVVALAAFICEDQRDQYDALAYQFGKHISAILG